MPDVKITFDQVKEKAAQIRSCNENLTTTLESIKSSITALESVYTSDASDTIRAKITGMQPQFNTYKEVIESYAAFLIQAAETYGITEGVINANASQFV